MADTKISALTSATTPLAGTEVLPIGQSSATVKVATNDLTVRNIRANAPTGILQVTGPTTGTTRIVTVPDANFTAARTDAAQSLTGDQTLSTGNLIQGTAAKGFNFTANTPAAGMTSQLLNWYEEGAWTPNQGAGLTVIGAFSSSGKYTRIGRQVTITGTVAGATSVAISAGGTICTNCPFAGSGNYAGSIFNAATGLTGSQVWQQTNTVYTIAAMAASTSHTFTVTYFI
jgi:hypothetical protein